MLWTQDAGKMTYGSDRYHRELVYNVSSTIFLLLMISKLTNLPTCVYVFYLFPYLMKTSLSERVIPSGVPRLIDWLDRIVTYTVSAKFQPHNGGGGVRRKVLFNHVVGINIVYLLQCTVFKKSYSNLYSNCQIIIPKYKN